MMIELHHRDANFEAELLLTTGAGPQPVVIVMHTGLGIGENVRRVAARLNALGYAVLLSDMFGPGNHGDVAKAGAVFAAMQADPSLIRERARLWFDTLAARSEIDPDRIAAIGYCFGGQCVLELARSGADVKAAVSFHGLLGTHAPAQPGTIKAEVAAWCGGRDPYAPLDAISAFQAEMSTADVAVQTTVFAGAEHGFTDRDSAALGRAGISYDAVADNVSWAGTVALLAHVLKP